MGIVARFFLDLAIIWEYTMGWFSCLLVSEAGIFFKHASLLSVTSLCNF